MSKISSEVSDASSAVVSEVSESFDDITIPCLECSKEFTWTSGEQAFFRVKELHNPPKRCKACKKAKNRRIEAVLRARDEGKRPKIEVLAVCAACGAASTVPFFPSQGRPVYCRKCFKVHKNNRASRANG